MESFGVCGSTMYGAPWRCVLVGNDPALTAMVIWSLPADDCAGYVICGPSVAAHAGEKTCLIS